MDGVRFDRIGRMFAKHNLARRRQETPDGLAEGTPIAAEWTGEKIPYLFVQSFQSGSLTANPDTGNHTLTLEQGLGQTVYFSDRPGRDVGIVPTPEFLSGLGFPEDNPPNAALVVETGDGETDLAVLELLDPVYDEATHTATYQVRGLEAWEDTPEQGFHDIPADLSSLPGEFGSAHLFIDDCPDDKIECRIHAYGWQEQTVGTFENQGFCYNYLLCIPCEPYGHTPPSRQSVVDYWSQRCNDTFADCNGGCFGHFTNRCALAGC
jgi:hypothetical protein